MEGYSQFRAVFGANTDRGFVRSVPTQQASQSVLTHGNTAFLHVSPFPAVERSSTINAAGMSGVATKNEFSGTNRKVILRKECLYCFLELRTLPKSFKIQTPSSLRPASLSPVCKLHGIFVDWLTVTVKCAVADGCSPSSGGCGRAMPFSLRR